MRNNTWMDSRELLFAKHRLLKKKRTSIGLFLDFNVLYPKSFASCSTDRKIPLIPQKKCPYQTLIRGIKGFTLNLYHHQFVHLQQRFADYWKKLSPEANRATAWTPKNCKENVLWAKIYQRSGSDSMSFLQ